jgi:photosystem II stability/assembly factor-like uncharacterized protein
MRAILCAALVAIAILPASVAASQPQGQPQGPPQWQVQAHEGKAELRGLSVVSDKVVWASGAKGTVLRTVDGGNWTLFTVPGAGEIDFRDIQAFDADTAIVMGAGPGAASRLYRTRDGGASWQLLATNPDAEGFWDAMAFWDARNGILFGDPVRGAFQVLVTADGGDSWQAVSDPQGLAALENEGAFAASGTCLNVAGKGEAWFVTGGAAKARIFRSSDRGRSWRASTLPIPAAAASKGAFSVAFADSRHGLVAGGDYKEAALATLNGARSEDGGASWTPAQILPAGFMSGLAPAPGRAQAYLAVGLAGSGFTRDGGRNWTIIDATTKLNAVGIAPSGIGWAVGPKGLIVKSTGPIFE